MNILVVGGGTKGKFGNDFVQKAREDGHKVYVISHVDNGDNDQDLYVIDFSFRMAIQNFLEELLPKIGKIDIIVYNTNIGGYPNNPNDDFTSKGWLNEQNYYNTVRLHLVIPHCVILQSFPYLHEKSKVVFFTTGLALEFKKNGWEYLVGYAGGKAWQTHLMRAFAEYNDKGVTFSSVSPYFNYNDKDHYSKVFNAVYEYIIEHDHSYNGRILSAWDDSIGYLN